MLIINGVDDGCVFVYVYDTERARERERAYEWVEEGVIYDISLDFTLASTSYLTFWKDAQFSCSVTLIKKLPLIVYRSSSDKEMLNILEGVCYSSYNCFTKNREKHGCILTKPKQKYQRPCTVCWWLEEVQSAPCITIAPVSADRGKIYDRKCYGCKRPQRGMKSKTLLKTRSPQKCKTKRRRKARERISYSATSTMQRLGL